MNTCIICGCPVKSRGSKTCSFACRERNKFLDKVESIQSRFDYPLKEIIESLYSEGLSMKQICEMLGYNPASSHCHIKLFNHFGITRRISGGFKKGGITDPTSIVYRKNKTRMIHNNPSTDPIIRRKMNIGKAKHLLENQSEMTKYVVKILTKYKVDFIQEKPVDIYIIDFVIGNIGLEIDGRGHSKRSQKDRKRDILLTSQGWKIIRINGDMRKPNSLRRKLENLILSGQIPSGNQT